MKEDVQQRRNHRRKRGQRETYGNGSCSPCMVVKRDRRGNVMIESDGSPVKTQERDRFGVPVWLVCVSLGVETRVDEAGNRRRRQVKVQKRVHGTLDDARGVARRLREDYSAIDMKSTTMTFSDACSSWLASMRNANTCSPAKLKDYETTLDRVNRKIGDKRLTYIKGQDIESALAAVKTERGLSQRRHRETFQIVKRVLEYCIDNDWLVRNPCRGLKTPRVTEETDRRSLTVEECARLRECLDRDELAAYRSFEEKELRQKRCGRSHPRSKLIGLSHISGLVAVRLMLATGMRRGETLGLTWEHVDFENRQITVRQSLNAQMVLKSPKTSKGVRTISIDDDTLEHLKTLKEFQARALDMVAGAGAGATPTSMRFPIGQTEKTPVCCNCAGSMFDPTRCAEWWRSYRTRIGFPRLKMHELRHTQATMLLGHGVGVKDVQARLGHASSSLTLDVYGHAIPANDRIAADLIATICTRPRK